MPPKITPSEPSTMQMTTIQRSILESEIIESMRQVFDPELPVNVYDLGLIYDIQIAVNKDVHVVMTLTSPSCPSAIEIPGDIEGAVRSTPGVGNVTIELTWDPPFTVEMMSEEARLMLGLD